MLGCLHNGRRLILMYKWDVAQAMEIIERERVTMFIAAPAITGDLVRAAEAEGRRLDSLLVIGGGGAPRAPDQVRAIARATPAAPTTGWGMTETNAIGAGVGGDGYLQRPDGVGWPSAVLDLRVVDAEGRELPRGEAGELQVRGTAVFRGYWRRPEENAAAFQDGWFSTGDLARFDEDGFVYIVDRLKDIVIRGGENISCPWVEAALYDHPAVVEAAVFGVPDARLGEELAATVVTTSDELNERELRDWLGKRLAAFQVPRRIETQREPLPRTASGKLAKRLIREAWLARALQPQETA
jgi:long-chain acyl-CoA synthetase